ncbi:MAG: DUF4145 domain-containing protein, partial [Candidatus Angelobacter sp.]
SDDNRGFWWSTTFEMLQCCGCQEVVLRRTYSFSENNEDEVRYFPPPVSRHSPSWRYDLPHDIRLLLDEIYRSLDANNRRLPMMGARALVDMVIMEKVGDIGGFKEKLIGLEKAGFISSKGRDVLYAALNVGNAAAHRGHAATASEVAAVMDIVENMLQGLYIFPETSKNLRKTTPVRKKKAAAHN